MLFADISKFNNVSDYLPIINGCINADLIIMFLVFHNAVNSLYLKKWYKKYQLSAVLADVLILFIGIVLTRFVYSYVFTTFSIWKFIILAVLIQISHDFLFYLFFYNVPRGYNAMLDFFKDYASEVGVGAIVGDSLMMTIACLLSSHFATMSANLNIILLALSVYFIPFMINYQ
jgi:hypothetical protein